MDKKKCICFFSSLYAPGLGGVETYTESLANALARMGFHSIVVTCNHADMPSQSVEGGVEVIRLPCYPLLHGRYPMLREERLSTKLWNYLATQDIDYVVINTRFYPLTLKALRFSRDIEVVPILIEHGSAHLTMGNPVIDTFVRGAEHAITSLCKRYPAAYYAVSKKASMWLRHFKISSCGEIPNSIDAQSYRASASDRNFRDELMLADDYYLVSFVGRLVQEKGVLELVDSIKMLQNEKVVLAIAGSGPLKNAIEQREGAAIRFLGRLTRPDVAALLMQSDMLCLPSRSEGFATVLLEASACETPSLITNVGGSEELIPNSNFGCILKEPEPNLIAQAIKTAVNNPEILKLQGANVKERVEKEYSWEKTALATIAACRQAQRND